MEVPHLYIHYDTGSSVYNDSTLPIPARVIDEHDDSTANDDGPMIWVDGDPFDDWTAGLSDSDYAAMDSENVVIEMADWPEDEYESLDEESQGGIEPPGDPTANPGVHYGIFEDSMSAVYGPSVRPPATPVTRWRRSPRDRTGEDPD